MRRSVVVDFDLLSFHLRGKLIALKSFLLGTFDHPKLFHEIELVARVLEFLESRHVLHIQLVFNGLIDVFLQIDDNAVVVPH